MAWTSEMRANRNPKTFNKRGERRSGGFCDIKTKREKYVSDDTKNRQKVVEEIETRFKQGEKIEDIANEIAQREEVKEQFDYYIKNGITDLGTIFANWYKGKLKAIERHTKGNGTR